MTAPQKDNRTLLLKVMHLIRLMVKETLRDSWYHCSKLIIIVVQYGIKIGLEALAACFVQTRIGTCS